MKDFSDYSSNHLNNAAYTITRGTENTRNFGQPFRTPGWTIVLVTGLVLGMEITLLVLVLSI